MFYNVYMQVSAGSAKFSTLDSWILFAAHKLSLLDAGAKVTFEPELREMGDGTPRVTAETVSMECASLRVAVAEYDFLRSTFHNVLTNLLFLDPHDMRLAIGIYRMRLNVQLVAKSKDVAIINITGSIQAGASVIDSERAEVFMLDDGTNYALIEGRVEDRDGVPLVGAFIELDTGETVLSNHNGEFWTVAPIAASALTVSLMTYTFSPVDLSLTAGQVYNFTIQEEKE